VLLGYSRSSGIEGATRAQDGAEELGYAPYIAQRRTEERKAEIGIRIWAAAFLEGKPASA
jgi:hypothetical protein